VNKETILFASSDYELQTINYKPQTVKYFLTTAIILFSLFAKAQVEFQPLSFNDALNKAEKEGKYLMVVLDAVDCEHCNEVADKGFADAKLAQQLSQKFIAIRPKLSDATWEQLAQQYETPSGMATLFFTANGILLHKRTGTSTMAKHYADAAERALARESEVLNLNSLTEAYNQNKKDVKVLQALLVKRRELYLSTDTLLDEYVALLSEDSLKSVHQLLFIARFAPVLESEADKVLRANPDRFNQAWYRMDLPTRVRINNSVIYKSRLRAIKSRDEANANYVANFAASTHSVPQAKTRAYDLNMMEYYRGVNNAEKFLSTAKSYYEKFVMNIPVDSVHYMDSVQKMKLLAQAKPDTVRREGNRAVVSKSISFTPVAQKLMNELNRGAWDVYKMTRNPEYINAALEWSARAVQLARMPGALDTHARLLYVSGKKQEAIELETEAIAKQHQMGFGTKEYEAVLAAMKAGKEKID
jgi:hypothetical protein